MLHNSFMNLLFTLKFYVNKEKKHDAIRIYVNFSTKKKESKLKKRKFSCSEIKILCFDQMKLK